MSAVSPCTGKQKSYWPGSEALLKELGDNCVDIRKERSYWGSR